MLALAAIIFDAANLLGVTGYWFEMRIRAYFQSGFKTFPPLGRLYFRQQLL